MWKGPGVRAQPVSPRKGMSKAGRKIRSRLCRARLFIDGTLAFALVATEIYLEGHMI